MSSLKSLFNKEIKLTASMVAGIAFTISFLATVISLLLFKKFMIYESHAIFNKEQLNVVNSYVAISCVILLIVFVIAHLLSVRYTVLPILKLFKKIEVIDHKELKVEKIEIENGIREIQVLVELLNELFDKINKNKEESAIAKLIFDNIKDGILVTDSNNQILSINNAFSKMSGYNISDIKGKSPKIFNSGLQDRAFYERMWSSLNTRGYWRGTIKDRRRDRTVYQKKLKIDALKDVKGQIVNYISIHEDETGKEIFDTHARFLAYHDHLTKLPNRELLKDRLQQLIAISAREDKEFAVLFLDIDQFRQVNEVLGHNSGDILLKEIAQKISTCIRSSDTIARLRGDEFVVLLVNVDRKEALEIAQKIADLAAMPTTVNGINVATRLSIGVSLYPEHAETIDKIVNMSDIAMQYAKKEGNKIVFYEPEMINEKISNRVFLLESEMVLGLNEDQFYLDYQPQFNLMNGICGVEALVRWSHPVRNLVSPGEFIPIAEESGLIIDIGMWVFNEALRSLKDFVTLYQVPFSVNFSARQLRQPDVVSFVKNSIELSGINPNFINLEITEGVCMENDIIMKNTLDSLRELGCHLSIDDFGTGYSNLAYLHSLPVSELKIDKSFVDTIGNGNEILIKTMIDIGHHFKMKVVAEGVESNIQSDWLFSAGCDIIQGYYYSKPVSLVGLMQLANKHNKKIIPNDVL